MLMCVKSLRVYISGNNEANVNKSISDYLFPLDCFPKKLHHIFTLTVRGLEAFSPGYQCPLRSYRTNTVKHTQTLGLKKEVNSERGTSNVLRPSWSEGRGRRRWSPVAVERFSFPCSPGSRRCSAQCGRRAGRDTSMMQFRSHTFKRK